MSASSPHADVYPNSPLALVVAEVRCPPVAAAPLGMSDCRRVRDELGAQWLIHNQREQISEVGADQRGPHSAVPVQRITTRDRTTAVIVREDRFAVETTDYSCYADFRDVVLAVASAVGEVLQPDGVERIGIRYINEISVGENRAWDEWIVKSLLPPTPPTASNSPTWWNGSAQYLLGERRALMVNYGTSEGPVVASGDSLRRKRVPQGPLFMLDFDSAWEPEDIPPFVAEEIVSETDALRAPIRPFFDALMQPKSIIHFKTPLEEDSS